MEALDRKAFLTLHALQQLRIHRISSLQVPAFYLATQWSITVMPSNKTNPLSPKKLLLSKWTAVKSIDKQKHFLVIKVILPEPPSEKIEHVELEAVFSKKVQLIAWRDLTNKELWIQGWK